MIYGILGILSAIATLFIGTFLFIGFISTIPQYWPMYMGAIIVIAVVTYVWGLFDE